MENGGESVIRGVGLAKHYKSGGGEITVFSNVNFSVPRGERLALVGESGAGKSSLLYLLGGLDSPSAGTIYFGNTDIVRLSAEDLAGFRNREIGFVWQNHGLPWPEPWPVILASCWPMSPPAISITGPAR